MKDDRNENSKPRLTVRRHSSSRAPLKYKVVSDEQVDFTQKAAYKFLELEQFQGERPVRENHVQFLYDEEVSGNFMWDLVIVAEAILGGKHYRINGQHTAWMRVHIDDNKKREVRWITFRVEDSEQLRALYSAFDRNAPRTAQHVSKVQLIGTEAGEGIPPGYLGRLVAGYRLYSEPDWKQTKPMSGDAVGRIKKDHALFNLVGRFFMMHYGDAIFVRRAAIIAGMFATFSQNVGKSDEFWSAVCSGLELSNKSDQRWQLRRYIETHSHAITAGRDVITQEDLYRVCINMWNHWRSGTAIGSVRVPSGEDRPKVKA